MTLHEAILFAMLHLSPLEKHVPPPGWDETIEARRARYVSIAEDIAAAAQTRAEAAVLVGVAWHESGFAVDVDRGPCYRGKGFFGRCDGGRAVSLWQLQDGDGARLALLRSDRREAAREALRRIRHSRKVCENNDARERLAAYAGGTCTAEHARRAARALDGAVRKALSLFGGGAAASVKP